MRTNLEPEWFSTHDTDRKAVEFVLDVGRLPSGGDVKAPAQGGQWGRVFTFYISPRTTRRRWIESGRCNNASEVVRAALRSLQETEGEISPSTK